MLFVGIITAVIMFIAILVVLHILTEKDHYDYLVSYLSEEENYIVNPTPSFNEPEFYIGGQSVEITGMRVFFDRDRAWYLVDPRKRVMDDKDGTYVVRCDGKYYLSSMRLGIFGDPRLTEKLGVIEEVVGKLICKAGGIR